MSELEINRLQAQVRDMQTHIEAKDREIAELKVENAQLREKAWKYDELSR